MYTDKIFKFIENNSCYNTDKSIDDEEGVKVGIVFLLTIFVAVIIMMNLTSSRKSNLENQSIIYDKNENIIGFKKIRFPFIMSIITFIIGTMLAYTSIGMPVGKDFAIVLLASYLPFIFFLVITLLCYYFGNKKEIRFVFKFISGVLTLLLLYYYVMAIIIIGFLEAENPVTNVKYYKHQVNGTELTKVFPKEIPDDVENVKFHYAPGVLQAGTNYMLYYVDKNMTMEKFDNNYKEKAIWIGHKKEYTEKTGLLSGAFSYTPANYKNEDDFIIYLVNGECDDSGYCNHGKFLLAAYNEQTNEVVFRAEYW